MKGQPGQARDRERWFNKTRPGYLPLRSATEKKKTRLNKITKKKTGKPKLIVV